MATEKNRGTVPESWRGSPPPAELAGERTPGPDEVVVESPTGSRTVVSKDAVESLKLQGYKVG